MVVYTMSVYCPDRNVLFIHVPRTAGTSMERCWPWLGGGHETVREYSNVPDSAFKFSFVRNPWDRLISAFACQTINKYAGRDKFREFVYFHCNKPGKYPAVGVYEDHFLPQWHFLLDNSDKIGVDYIGRFEWLQRDWSQVCKWLGVRRELPHERKGNRDYSCYMKYYTSETWDIVGRLYKRDVDLFGYGEVVFTPVNAMISR